MENTKENTAEAQARAELKKKAFEVYSRGDKVLIQAGTGVGKSKLALDLAETDLGSFWTVFVPRRPLFKTWKDEKALWHSCIGSEFYCYASARKVNGTDRNIILDECHRLTENSLQHVKKLLGTRGKLICLSATVPEKKKELLAQLGIDENNTVRYSLDRAVENNLVTDYRITVVQFPLDSFLKQVQAGRKGNYFFTTEEQGYRFQDQKARQAKYSGNPEAVKWAMLARMRYIYNLPSKLLMAREILKYLPMEERTIVFCGSIQHAEALGMATYHSRKDDKEWLGFCDGKISRIAVVQSVAEGVNVSDIDNAVIMQVQREDLHTIQRIGRAVRKNPKDPHKVASVFVLEALNTQDSVWRELALRTFEPDKINYLSSTQLLTKGL